MRKTSSRTPFHKIPQGDFIDDCRLIAIGILGSFLIFLFQL